MERYIAFLRAINVGGHTVKMEVLRKLFTELGFENVETFIASGNVIFEAPDKGGRALEEKVEQHLKQALGYEVATFIRTPRRLVEIAGYEPFADAAGATLYIGFLPAAPSAAAREKLLGYRNDVDDFHVHDSEVYWLGRQGMAESTFSGAQLEKTLAMPATLRNSTTVKRLAAKYGTEK